MIFIVGVGRSGTSMLQSMLDAHSMVSFLPETQYVRHYLSSDSKIKEMEQAGVSTFIGLTAKDENLNKDPELKTAWDELMKSRSEVNLVGAFNDLVELQLKSTGKGIGGEKDAGNIDFLDRLSKYFPKSKVILIYRDPREVVLSKTKASWSSGRPYWQHSLIGNAQLHHGIKNGNRLLGDQFYSICYENLLSEPEEELKVLCSFLDIPFEPQMMEFYKKASRLFVAKREMQFKSNNFKPLIRNNSGKWKKELSRHQVSFIEATNAGHFKKLGYELSGYISPNSLKWQFYKTISSLFVKVYPLIEKMRR